MIALVRARLLRPSVAAAWLFTIFASTTPATGSQPIADVNDDDDFPPIDLPGPRRGERTPKENVPPTHVTITEPFYTWDRALGDLFGVRKSLEDMGISIDAALIYDSSSAWVGGLHSRSTSRALLDVGATIDFDKMFDIAGGTFFIDFQGQNGRDSTAEVGDIQGFSNIDAPNRAQLNEIWYEQWFLGDLFRVKVGKLDANGEFAYVDHGGEFINSSMGFSPTIFTLPTYPDPAFSVNVFAYPTDWLYVGFGVYDGSGAQGVATGQRGVRTFFSHNAGELFLIGEVGVVYDLFDHLPGRVAFGAWGHTADFTRFDGGTEDGTTGFYLLADQAIWRENPDNDEDEQGLSAFLQAGWADGAVSEIDTHIGGGATWTGLIPGRDDDILGLGATWVSLSDEPGAGFTKNSELTFEWFYRLQLTPALAIKPDLQWIVDPGGDASVNDAVVGTLRVEFVF